MYAIAPGVALVQTVDFFTPIVDDPYQYGQIAAANSLSDVYAMGGRPVTAMNILCYPIKDRDINELGAILRGGSDKVAEAGVALVGGHSVEDPEPKFGLAVTGLVDPAAVASNSGARPGDVIVLTKPLGTGIVTTAAKFDACPADVLLKACQSMASLNAPAASAMRTVGIGPNGVHAATDITGFSLLGHLYRLARASGVGLDINSSALPLLEGALPLAEQDYVTRGDRENRAYIGEALEFVSNVSKPLQSIMLDPQTSGGLAIFVAEDRVGELLSALEDEGVLCRAVIGKAVAGESRIRVS